ncbi:MAG: hypothetical protein WA324_30660, partial [Bryobacteraceae bacterium]
CSRSPVAWKWTAAAVCVSLISWGALTAHGSKILTSHKPTLKVVSAGPDLLISWSGLDPRISHPDLHITDGETRTDVDIEDEKRSGGQLVYRPRSARVEAVLLTYGGQKKEASVLYVRAQSPPLLSPLTDEFNKIEVEQLKAKNRRLEAFVQVLKKRPRRPSRRT